ncbi:MAG: thiamine ABC transporter ATP-binding protein [Aestuariivirga sp.]|uniref:thiamine ABC transporter ATP-binding protein n=1 Tax=Aestuariivirga sp. TaxID=2650926 RepID=UPI0025B96909|nr:thiamine ABC transporter ATP-binding protein [Aestuariivirga sp.]MCA3561658.1 thiamine ABC transporter ATP-binding protein [Aestuariivirga sp.]
MIRLDDVTFRYEDLQMRFDVDFPSVSFTAVIGPSGGGKSTLLNLIAGFEAPEQGRVLIAGADVTALPPDRRPVSMIFQDNNVFAHLDLWQNVAIGIAPSLKLDAGQRKRVDAALAGVGLGALMRRKPGEVSGGERQRVAVARALVRDRPVLLLDEPFAALGPALRRDMLDLVKSMQQARGLTVVMVTHQPEDALAAASHTAYLENGRILALRSTAELFAARDLPGLEAYLGDWRSTGL